MLLFQNSNMPSLKKVHVNYNDSYTKSNVRKTYPGYIGGLLDYIAKSSDSNQQ